MIKIAPSILSADFSCLKEQIQQIEKGGAKYVHIDVMDGMFVPNITMGPVVIESIRKHTDLVFDVHLMIEEPERYIKEFAEAGADIITVHVEATKDIRGCIEKIKSFKKRAGVSIKPATPVSAIKDILGELDMVLVMSVEPGFGGQKYIDSADEKLRELKELMPAGTDISVDGGIKLDNIDRVIKNGANTVVAGSAVFGAENIEEQTRLFVDLANKIEAQCV
ncbi:MAG: ribulose-phosphate 3-epimerase [Ruminococcaceae bacterium]|nr:ribulose-phosphate 3-epimerase [Oscillospiraceae bacterium]